MKIKLTVLAHTHHAQTEAFAAIVLDITEKMAKFRAASSPHLLKEPITALLKTL